MKVIVAGSRSITDYKVVYNAIMEAPFTGITHIISGMARGVDQLAVKFAEHERFGLLKFPADWDKHGKSAGFIRNAQMAQEADALIAIWDGKSRGTKNMIDIMNKMEKPVFIKEVND